MKGLTYLEIIFSISLISIFTFPVALGIKASIKESQLGKEYLQNIMVLENEMIELDEKLNFDYEPLDKMSYVVKNLKGDIVIEKNNSNAISPMIPYTNIGPVLYNIISITSSDLDGDLYYTDIVGEHILENKSGQDITIIGTGEGEKHFKIISNNYSTKVINLNSTAIVSYIENRNEIFLSNLTLYNENGEYISSITNLSRNKGE